MAGATRYIVEDVERRGRQYVTYSDGSQWTRRVDAVHRRPLEDWRQLEPAPTADATKPEPLKLHVVARLQAEGEPKHWALYAARTDFRGETLGQAWQVTGDAECMHYDHESDVDLFSCDTFGWHQTLNTDLGDAEFAVVDQVARSEPPPRAKNRREVTENCQGWTIRVLRQLISEDIVKLDSILDLQERMDPIN